MIFEIIFIISTIFIVFYSQTRPRNQRKFCYGYLIASILWMLLNVYYFWQANYVNEYEITFDKMWFHVQKKLESSSGQSKAIQKMTKRDIELFFKDPQDYGKDRMRVYIENGFDIVSHADVVDGGQIFSIMSMAYRDKRNNAYDYLNWKHPHKTEYLINSCYIDLNDEKVMKLARELFPKEFFDSIGKNAIIAKYTTIRPSREKDNKFRIVDVPFHPMDGYQADSIRMVFKKYTPDKMCFHSF